MALRRPRSACELRRPERKTLLVEKLQLPKWKVTKGPRHHETLAPKAEVARVGEAQKLCSTGPPTPEAVTPKQRPPECLTDTAVHRAPALVSWPDAATSRTEVPLPGLAELQKSHAVFERWSCFPELQTQLHPSRASALRLHKVLREPQVNLEMDLVGPVNAESRRVLLMWCLACCLELLGFLENAAALFAKCTAADVGNPVHAYNRGCVLLRLHQWQAASRDFDLAANHCLQRGWLLPPMLLVRRALANRHLHRMPEVWADFELARLRTRFPSWSLRQLQRQMAREEVNSYAGYCRALASPAMRLAAHRHWLATFAGRKFEDVTEAVRLSLLELLRGIPGFAQLQLNGVPWDAMSIVLLRGGQPLLPSYSELFILFSGKLQVLRFAPPLSFGSFGRLSSEGTVPEALLVAPFLEEEAVLSAPSSFCGPQGSQQDGWLVACDDGASLLQITMEGVRSMC